MNNTLHIECLMQAFSEYFEAKREHDEARDKYLEGGGYSWGYFGCAYVEAVEKKALQIQDYFAKVVAAAVAAELEEYGIRIRE